MTGAQEPRLDNFIDDDHPPKISAPHQSNKYCPPGSKKSIPLSKTPPLFMENVQQGESASESPTFKRHARTSSLPQVTLPWPTKADERHPLMVDPNLISLLSKKCGPDMSSNPETHVESKAAIEDYSQRKHPTMTSHPRKNHRRSSSSGNDDSTDVFLPIICEGVLEADQASMGPPLIPLSAGYNHRNDHSQHNRQHEHHQDRWPQNSASTQEDEEGVKPVIPVIIITPASPSVSSPPTSSFSPSTTWTPYPSVSRSTRPSRHYYQSHGV